jgi:virginiamycin A acetyltransferase
VVAVVIAFPAIAGFALRSRCLGPDRALEASSQWLSLIPGVAGQYLRNAFLRHALAHCSPTATVSFGTLLSKVGARIGDRAYVGPHCHLGLALIQADVLIGAGVHVTSGRRTHGTEDSDRPIREQAGRIEPVTVGQGAWIGSNAVVMADVGPGAVVAAGAVVVEPVSPGTVVGGVPARVIRQRTAVASQAATVQDRL